MKTKTAPPLTMLVMAVTGILLILTTVECLTLQASRPKKCAVRVMEANKWLTGMLSSFTEVAKLTDDQKFH